MESKIAELEEELRQAMLASDVEKLDELIDDSLVFVTPGGTFITKQMDLDVHKNKAQTMSELTPSEQNIQLCGDSATVTVKMKIVGKYNDTDISGDYTYLRVWKKVEGCWKIIAGSVVQVQ